MDIKELFKLAEYEKTRNSERTFFVEQWNKRVIKFSIRHRNTNNWNLLPNSLKFAPNLNRFKNLIDSMPKFIELFYRKL